MFKKTRLFQVLVLFIFAATTAHSGDDMKAVPMQKAGQEKFVKNEIIVKFANDKKPFRIIKVPDKLNFIIFLLRPVDLVSYSFSEFCRSITPEVIPANIYCYIWTSLICNKFIII